MQDNQDFIKDIEESALRQLSQKKLENPNEIIKESPFPQEKKSEYKPNPLLKTLRTFKGDVEEAVNKKNESVVSIASKEEKRKDVVMQEAKETGRIAPEKEVFKEKRGLGFLASGLWLTVGSALIATGLITLGVLYISKSKTEEKQNVVLNKTIIQYTDKKDVSLGVGFRQDIISSISSAVSSYNQPVSSVLYLNLLKDKSSVDTETFLNALFASAPNSLNRSFASDYMLGILSFDTNEPFIILSPENYGAVYSGMLKWEPSMYYDLSPIFKGLTNSKFQVKNNYTFSDYTYKNNDVRILRNDNNEIVLIYGFVDKKTLIITANERVFNSLVQKYINSKVVR
jgi:hypothetical protein